MDNSSFFVTTNSCWSNVICIGWQVTFKQHSPVLAR